MKKYIAAAGALVLALAMSGLPAAAFAESDQGDNDGAQAQLTQESAREQQKQRIEVSREQQKDLLEQEKDAIEALSSSQDDDELEFELEDDEDVAFSLDDLKQKIEERKLELEDEEASTTPKFKNAMKNANEVRLAVHALLASKDLLGGIGQQVSEIAKQMNDSVATTTNAEAQIESRGFFAKIFFGGAKKTAEVISKEVERNQKSIEKLKELLDRAALSADFQTALKAQITALEEAQARFQIITEKEQSRWGFFSWRF